jgi:fido (protein-threonine AMPylation protein)
MHPLDCPNWEYNDHPNQPTLRQHIASVLIDLRSGDLDTLGVATDTRPKHRKLFYALTPVGCDYFAGHYRGENYRCLQFYSVGIASDPRVGVQPSAVAYHMGQLSDHIRAALMALDANALLAPKDRARLVIALACSVFVNFLTIHPYANGNGHVGRLIIWCILARYGLWPQQWTVEPRPPDPPYTDMITEYRNGNPNPLEFYLLGMLSH